VNIGQSPAGIRNRDPLQQSMDMIFGDLWHFNRGIPFKMRKMTSIFLKGIRGDF
jgi:hypothetical protein